MASLAPSIDPSRDEVAAHLDTICASPVFSTSTRMIRFLRLVVEETLAGTSDRLSEYVIGIDVYDRSTSFDPRLDSIVRVEARRLRGKLAEYYRTAGTEHEWVIEIPLRTYGARFRARTAGDGTRAESKAGGKYQLDFVLEEDSLCQVWSATDTVLGRPVRVEVIRGFDDGTQVKEAIQRRASLTHPGLCDVYEASFEPGNSHVVTRAPQGQPLQVWLEENALTQRAAALIAQQVAEAIGAAHAKGCVHGSLSPANIFVDLGAEGQPAVSVTKLRAIAPAGASVEEDLQSVAAVARLLRRPAASRKAPFYWALSAAAVAMALGAGGWLAWRQRPTTPVTPRVAVLPFQSIGDGAKNGGLALAVTDLLTAKLAQNAHIQVISRSSAAVVDRKRLTMPQIAAKLKADYLLEGTILGDQGVPRLTAQLIRAGDDTYLWSGEYQVEGPDMLRVQGAIVQGVLKQVGATQNDQGSMPGDRTNSFEAFQAFGHGLDHHHRFVTTFEPGEFEAAESWYQRAFDLDPKYADAMTALGRLYMARLYPVRDTRTPWVMKAKQILERAVWVEPGHARANSLLATIYAQEGNLALGLQHVRDALRGGRANAEVCSDIGEAFTVAGFYEEGVAYYKRGIQQEPTAMGPAGNLVLNYGKMGNFREGHQALQPLLDANVFPLLTPFLQGDLLLREGRGDFAVKNFPRGWATPGDVAEQSAIDTLSALNQALRGNLTPGRAVVARYEQLPPRRVDWFIRLSALTGAKDVTIRHIRTSPFYNHYRWVVEEPAAKQFRGDPQFQALVRGLAERWDAALRTGKGIVEHVPPQMPKADEYLAR